MHLFRGGWVGATGGGGWRTWLTAPGTSRLLHLYWSLIQPARPRLPPRLSSSRAFASPPLLSHSWLLTSQLGRNRHGWSGGGELVKAAATGNCALSFNSSCCWLFKLPPCKFWLLIFLCIYHLQSKGTEQMTRPITSCVAIQFFTN